MRLNESKLLILLSCIILGFIIASQLSFTNFIPRKMVTLQSYQEMTTELKVLTDEIGILEERKRQLTSNLWQYELAGDFKSEIQKFVDELEKYEHYIGLSDVEGPGVVVYLNDRSPESILDSREIVTMDIVHDADIVQLVGELKAGGAEAISINDQRVIHNTDIYCGGPVIYVNGLELVPPYIIKAIGDPESLSYILTKDDSYYSWLESRGLNINFRKENSIKVFGYDRKLEFQYMKPQKEQLQ